ESGENRANSEERIFREPVGKVDDLDRQIGERRNRLAQRVGKARQVLNQLTTDRCVEFLDRFLELQVGVFESAHGSRADVSNGEFCLHQFVELIENTLPSALFECLREAA